MKIKRKKVSAQVEEQIVTGMIVSDAFLKDIIFIYDEDLMEVPYARIVAGWCKSYWEAYGKAPGKDIQSVFNSKKRHLKRDEKEHFDLIESFLQKISMKHEEKGKFNAAYHLDEAERIFNLRRQNMLADDIKATITNGDPVEVEKIIADFRVAKRPMTDAINPFDSSDLIADAFDSKIEYLFKFPGELGKMIGPIERDTFISLIGPEKRGKTWWLIEWAMRAARQRCNVAFFSVGDMSKLQITRRFHIYNTRMHPRSSGQTLIPIIDCDHNQTGECDLSCRVGKGSVYKGRGKSRRKLAYEEVDPKEYTTCSVCQRKDPKAFAGAIWYRQEFVDKLTWAEAYRGGQKFVNKMAGKNFLLDVHPSGTFSINDIENALHIWEDQSGFVADLIAIDYADVIAPDTKQKDVRHQINDIWMGMRGLSQKKHACVITATQSTKQGNRRDIDPGQDVSEDKRKLAHVTMMLALNQTPEEKRANLMRITQIAAREDEYDIAKHVKVGYQLKIGRPYLFSFL